MSVRQEIQSAEAARPSQTGYCQRWVSRTSPLKAFADAGSLIWTLGTTPEFPYNVGYDAFSIYPTADPYSMATPSGYVPPTQTAGEAAANQEFYGTLPLPPLLPHPPTHPLLLSL